MKAAVPNIFDGTFEIGGHGAPMVARPYPRGRFTLDDLISRAINKVFEHIKHRATARSFISSF